MLENWCWQKQVLEKLSKHHLTGEQLPEVVKQLLGRLDYFVNLSIPQDRGIHDPNSDPSHFGGVWTPWLGNPNPPSAPGRRRRRDHRRRRAGATVRWATPNSAFTTTPRAKSAAP